MQRRTSLVAALSVVLLLSCSAAERPTPSPIGLWVWHEAWQSAPDEIVKDSGPQWTATGALVRFCPDGTLRLAMGVLYRGGGSVTLGSSDGLTTYQGEWHSSEHGLEVQYHLTFAEIEFTGYEQALARQLVDQPTIVGNELSLNHHWPRDNRAFRMSFTAASSLPEKTWDRFVECEASRD